jgi:RimJ/RimL family protein N-acetyltransferase
MVELIQGPKPGWVVTERLSMRPMGEEDVTLFCGLYGDPETMRFIGPPLSRERAQRTFRLILSSRHSQPFERLFLVIIEKATQQAIGIGAFQHFDAQRRRVETGMVLNSESRGRGFGKDGLCALVTHGFAILPVDEVWIQHAADNRMAERVPVSLGLLRNMDAPRDGVAPGNYIWSAYRELWPVRG